jgi:hypothetical protein
VAVAFRRNRNTNDEDLVDYEKMWNEFSTCVELLLHDLDRTLRLLRRFPLTSKRRIGVSVDDDVSCGMCFSIAAQVCSLPCFLKNNLSTYARDV